MTRSLVLSSLLSFALSSCALADSFGTGGNTFNVDFVAIGNPGNLPDTSGNPNPVGSVAYKYNIGKYDISRDMITKANALGNLGITLADMTAIGGNGVNRPATGVSWNEAARFINWLDTSIGSPPAYKFALQPGDGGYNVNANIQVWTPSDPGYNPTNLYRNSLAHYFLPSVDEWYKAAFYNPTSRVYYDYPTGSNIAPTFVTSGIGAGTAVYNQSDSQGPADITLAGGLSPYGTMGQGGNVHQWVETDFDSVNGPIESSADGASFREYRGGNWFSYTGYLESSTRSSSDARVENNGIGFRVASTPEPSTLLLGAIGCSFVLAVRRRSVPHNRL